MPPDRVRLVGRDPDLDRLGEAFRAAAAGRPGIVLVSGEAGIGKTRLIEELIDELASAPIGGSSRAPGPTSHRVALGRCSPAGATRLPYGPVVELLTDLIRQVPDLSDSVTTGAWGPVAWLTGAQPEVVPTADPQLASTRLFVAIVDLLAAAARRCPTLVVLEDVHWADPATMDLVTFVARRLRDERLLVVLTHRPVTGGSEGAVRSTLSELGRLPTAVDLHLGPLPPEATRALLGELSADPGQVDQLAARSEGIPFFALHLAAHAAQSAQSAPGAVPPRLRDVLLTLVDDLSPAQRSVLMLLTAVGDASDDGLLLAASQLPAEEFSRVVRGLVGSGVVALRDGSIGFRHALLREIVLEDALPAERAAAHARAADALLASPAAREPRRAGQLSRHLLECGRHREAISYAVLAAQQATAIWAFADARELFALARGLWRTVEAPQAATGLGYPELVRLEAMASRWCGRLEESLDLLRSALEQADLAPLARAALEHSHGQVLWATGDPTGAVAAQRRAEQLLGAGLDDVLRSAVLAALAHGQMVTGQCDRAEQTAAQAIVLGTAVGAARDVLHASITAAAARAQLGDVDTAVDALRRCLPQALGLDDLELVVRCYGNLTFALGIACRYPELAAAAAEGLAVCRRYGPVISLASTLVNNQVNALVTLGRWDDAVAAADLALAEGSAANVALHLRVVLATVAVARGEQHRADELLGEVRELAGDDPYLMSAFSVLQAERALLDRRPQLAAAAIHRALPSLLAQDDALPLLEACWLGLRAAADLAQAPTPGRTASRPAPGDPDLIEICVQAAGRTALPVAAAVLAMSRAEAARVTGEDTVQDWTAAARANADLGRPYLQAYCLWRLGIAALRGQARTAAAQALGQALGLAGELGARPLADEIRTMITLGNLRVDTPSPAVPPARSAPSPPYGLTARELAVLQLLTTGATNRRIGRALFISERTAGVHVGNILAKLGVANRTEAARVAIQLNLDTDHGR